MSGNFFGKNSPIFLVTFLCAYQVDSQTVLLSESYSTTNFNATLSCGIIKNGTFLKDPNSCTTWIQCIDKEPISGSCANGLFYNKNTSECVPSNSIKCYSSNPCADVKNDGTFVADPYSCSSYYYCSNGKATLGVCSAGLNYNPETQVCIQNFKCSAKIINSGNWCNIIPDGQFFGDVNNCQGYYFCNNGFLDNGTCPDGYYFDSFKSICDYQANVVCQQSETEDHKIEPSGDGICQIAGQFVSDNTTCSGYFYCHQEADKNYSLIWNNCSDGKFFDPSNGGECGYRRDVDCKFDRCDGTGLQNIQLVNAQEDDCKGYLVCQDGKQIGQGMCPDEEPYFDEQLQRCTSSVVRFPACSTNEF